MDVAPSLKFRSGLFLRLLRNTKSAPTSFFLSSIPRACVQCLCVCFLRNPRTLIPERNHCVIDTNFRVKTRLGLSVCLTRYSTQIWKRKKHLSSLKFAHCWLCPVYLLFFCMNFNIWPDVWEVYGSSFWELLWNNLLICHSL